jgi:hypothetical protein
MWGERPWGRLVLFCSLSFTGSAAQRDSAGVLDAPAASFLAPIACNPAGF